MPGVVGLAAARRVERGAVEGDPAALDVHAVTLASNGQQVGVAEVQQLGRHRRHSAEEIRRPAYPPASRTLPTADRVVVAGPLEHGGCLPRKGTRRDQLGPERSVVVIPGPVRRPSVVATHGQLNLRLHLRPGRRGRLDSRCACHACRRNAHRRRGARWLRVVGGDDSDNPERRCGRVLHHDGFRRHVRPFQCGRSRSANANTSVTSAASDSAVGRPSPNRSQWWSTPTSA